MNLYLCNGSFEGSFDYKKEKVRKNKKELIRIQIIETMSWKLLLNMKRLLSHCSERLSFCFLSSSILESSKEK